MDHGQHVSAALKARSCCLPVQFSKKECFGSCSNRIPVGSQAHKVYVQQRLREAGQQVWRLLESGAHFYVCGDAASMAGSVEQALLDIISQHQVSAAEPVCKIHF